jgi:hypothetical protein
MADHEPPREGGWIQTFTGGRIYPMDARLEELNVKDIAHALANTCRYGGHCIHYYSVAQHSVLVSHACKSQHALTGLMHDAAEAYLGDMPRPIKHGPGMGAFRSAERALERLIAARFGLVFPFPNDVVWADSALLATEKRDLLRKLQVGEVEWLHGASSAQPLSTHITAWSPLDAEAAFLDRYRELTREQEDGGW